MRNFTIAFLLLLSLNNSVFAQQAEKKQMDNLLSMNLEELMQVVVTGSTLTNESLVSVPSAVTVFNRAQIERLGFDYLHELLDLVPSYQTQRDADTPAFYRFFSSRGRRNISQATEVLLLVDGKILNDSLSGGANMVIPLSQVERVEIIRGPGSALYGASAHSGVINVITRQGQNEIGIAAGSLGRWQTHVLGNMKKEDWQLDVYAQIQKENGQEYQGEDIFMPTTRRPINDATQANDLSVNLRYQDTKLQFTHKQRKSNDFYVAEQISDDFNSADTQLTQVSLEQSIHWAAHIQSHLLYSWSQRKGGGTLELFPAGRFATTSYPSDDSAAFSKNTYKSRLQQLKIHTDWKLTNQSSTQFGVEWLRQEVTYAEGYSNFNLIQLATGTFPIASSKDIRFYMPLIIPEMRDSMGLYAQYLYDFNEDTHLTLGARYDAYEHEGTRLSPRIALVHMLSPVHTLKILYGEAFRVPSLTEQNVINNPTLVGNPNLKNEVVKTLDLIWLINTPTFSSSLGYFFNHYQNPVEIQNLSGVAITYTNHEDSNAQGFEFEANYQFAPHWLVRGTLTYFSELPTAAFREADILASLMLNYEAGAWNWNLSGIYHGEREISVIDTLHTLDDYWLFNTKLRYQFDKNLNTYLQVKNLLDEDYYTTSLHNFLTEGIPNRGREWLIGIEYQF